MVGGLKQEINMPFSKYSAKQKRLARVAVPRDKITGADFRALKRKKKKKKK
tara:strand:+ start:2496 stop:2648 length:153 start_codon:yes stop_codon:yes gene_type:complete